MYMLDVLALAEGLLVLVVLGDLVSRRGLSAHYMTRSMWGSDYDFTDYRFINNSMSKRNWQFTPLARLVSKKSIFYVMIL